MLRQPGSERQKKKKKKKKKDEGYIVRSTPPQCRTSNKLADSEITLARSFASNVSTFKVIAWELDTRGQCRGFRSMIC
eukprot:277076-Rhodomonas_salina.2